MLPIQGKIAQLPGWPSGSVAWPRNPSSKPAQWQLQTLANELFAADVNRRLSALEQIESLGPAAAPAIPDLLRGVEGANPAFAESCASALSSIGPRARCAIPALTRMVLKHVSTSGTNSVASVGIMALVNIGIDGVELEDFVPRLIRMEATYPPGGPRLENLCPQRLLAPHVCRLVRDTDVRVRIRAIELVEWLGEAANSATGDLIAALRDPDPWVASSAASALGRVTGNSHTIGALTRCLASPVQDVRWAAARSLGRLGPPAAIAQEPLHALWADSAPGIRIDAARAYAAVGGDHEKVAHFLVAEFRRSARNCDVSLLLGLGELGVASPDVIDVLESVLLGTDENAVAPLVSLDVSAAAGSLAKLMPKCRRCLEVLLQALDHGSLSTRCSAAMVLSSGIDVGPAVREAIDRAAAKDWRVARGLQVLRKR